jgi:hemoglobin
MNDGSIPSLSDWVGGAKPIEELLTRFYEKVRLDTMLSAVFAGMSSQHAKHVSAFITEVFGGTKLYSQAGGSHAKMIAHHMGRQLSHEQRRAWVTLLLDTADEVGIRDDPEFRASFVGYLEWGSRLAVMNSQQGVPEPEKALPMPEWTWSSPGRPYQP